MDIQKIGANFCILEPGDVTAYKFMIGQTAWQKSHGEVMIALVDMGRGGAAFSYSTDTIKYAWHEMSKEKNLQKQLENFAVVEMNDLLPMEVKNLFTARAIIEATARWLRWRSDG